MVADDAYALPHPCSAIGAVQEAVPVVSRAAHSAPTFHDDSVPWRLVSQPATRWIQWERTAHRKARLKMQGGPLSERYAALLGAEEAVVLEVDPFY